MPCEHCVDARGFFGQAAARHDLRRFRRRGAAPTTAWLVDAVSRHTEGPLRLLDIGGGIGAIQHLLSARIVSGTAVDASAAYLEAARGEAARQGYAGRMTYLEGDFVELAPSVGVHDVVTLDRVLCCYPDPRALVPASAGRAGRVYGVVIPREAWWIRVGFALLNAWFRLRRSSFRVYLHAPAEIDALVRASGFTGAATWEGRLWQGRVYVRSR